jgi:L-threonylcarbamoyladenylate synthase|tara:strand:- start:1140 stop:1733 length:594 start_codon:yes stop_codon:yes gene_type:complete
MENTPKKMKHKVINWSNDKALGYAKQIILDGGIIVYPTDTIYGFGVDATNENSIKVLNKLKERTGPISVLASDKKIVSNWINIPKNEKRIALKKLQDHKTIIFPVHKGVVNNLILGKHNTLGIRIPDHPFCILLSQRCGIPITTTSVNRSGEHPKTNINDIIESFGDNVDLIIEDGELNNPSSDIYSYQDQSFKKLR